VEIGGNHNAIGIDANDNLLLLDADQGLERVDPTGHLAQLTALEGGDANRAVDLAVDRAGNVWVTRQTDIVVVARDHGRTTIPLQGAFASHVAADGQGNVWVGERRPDHSTVLAKFAAPGDPAGTFPIGFVPNGLAGDAQGGVWASDQAGNVHKYAPDGSELGKVAVGGVIYGLAQAADGRMWVTQAGLDRVVPISPSLELGQAYATGPNPGAVTIDGAGRVWVLNVLDGSVTRVTPPALPPTPVATFEIHGSQAGPAGLVATVGDPLQLVVTAGTAASWKTADPAIATVDAGGKLSPVAPGVVEVTATLEGHEGKVTVVVRDASAQDARPIRLPEGTSGRAPMSGGLLVADQDSWDGIVRALFKPLPPPSPAPTVPIAFDKRRVLLVAQDTHPNSGEAVVLRLSPTVLVGYPRGGGYGIGMPAVVYTNTLAAFDIPAVPDGTPVEVAGVGVVQPIAWGD
jgi:sugar lactone lactonase YvrE